MFSGSSISGQPFSTLTTATGTGVNVFVTGLEATGLTNDEDIFVFAVHVPNQNPNYDCTPPTQDPSWTKGSV